MSLMMGFALTNPAISDISFEGALSDTQLSIYNLIIIISGSTGQILYQRLIPEYHFSKMITISVFSTSCLIILKFSLQF